MSQQHFFQLASGIVWMLVSRAMGVRTLSYEDKAEHAFLNITSLGGVYRLELNHQTTPTHSTLKVRLFEGTMGSLTRLQPRIDRLNDLGKCKWIHYAGTICTDATFHFAPAEIGQEALEPVIAFIELALESIRRVR